MPIFTGSNFGFSDSGSQEVTAMVVPVLHHAPVVRRYARNFKHVFANEPEYEHCKNYLTGLFVAERKNYSQMAACLVKSADATNISRFMSSELWSGAEFNDRRVELIYDRSQKIDAPQRGALLIDDTLDEHVGTLMEHIARHYDHCEGSYKLAQNPVTSHYLRGRVSFPVETRSYRNYDEVTNWEAHFRQHFPEVELPKPRKERNKLKQKYEKRLLVADPEFAAKHAAFETKLKLAGQLVDDAIARGLSFELVLFDAWYLAPELIAVIERHQKGWISILKKNRKLQTAGLKIQDAEGKHLSWTESEIKVQDLVPLIPKTAYHPVKINDQTTYYATTFTARIETLGKVRIVISFADPTCEGQYAVLVTRQMNWEAKRILKAYCGRFQVEVFYKDAKQHLGFSDYQCRTAPARQKHWYLVFAAYSLLKLDLLHAPLYQTWQRKLKTIGVVLRRQAQSLVEQMILACHRILSQGTHPEQLFKLLFGEPISVA
jgi:hypothetical protein